MDCIQAILERRSCRSFLNQKVEEEKITKILECGIYAPSPANKQPWEFIVVENQIYNGKLYEISEQARVKVAERSGWKWLPKFNIDFIKEAPVLIIVVGDSSKNGAEQFLDNPSQGYEQACCAAVQNMSLAAHSLGLATLWLSLYEKNDVRKLFIIEESKDPVAIICLGYPKRLGEAPPRKGFVEKVKYIK